MKNLLFTFALVVFFASPCFAAEEPDDLFDEYETEDTQNNSLADPLYYVNKGVFFFNDKLYFWALKPVAEGYDYVMPDPAQRGVRNFFYNLAYPLRFVSSLLQCKFKEAGQETVLFGFNTIYGGLGFMKEGQEYFGWQGSDEDLGQALGSYGMGGGIYLVLPVFGPSNLRDTAGIVGGAFLSPLGYIGPYWALGGSAANTINSTSLKLGDYEAVMEAAVDPYISIKDGYTSLRDKKINE